MTAKTHRQYSISFALLAIILNNILKIADVNYYVSIPIILMASRFGGLFPDLDHNWQSVKDKTVPNWIINKIIHLTKGKHRSWQTHSLDIAIVSAIVSILGIDLIKLKCISYTDIQVIKLLFIGFYSGWLSHLVSDMLTSSGVRILCYSRFKLALVPKNIGKLKFNTGNEWEEFCFLATRKANIVIGIAVLAYPLLNNEHIINIIQIMRD